MKAIIDSFYNGQMRQMVNQIKEYGEVNFAYDINDEPLDVEDKVEILTLYLKLKK